jgi:hypothetical protein
MSHCAGRRSAPILAHDYYYDATLGNNANSGHEDAPLQTMANLNARTLKPGDRVFFKRGETWSGVTYTPTDSGAAGRPITYDAYGSGALPVIIGTGSYCINCSKDYIHIKNIDINGNGAVVYGLALGGHDNVVDGCVARSCTEWGIWGNGTSVYVYNSVFRNNTVYSNTHSGMTGGSGHARVNCCWNCLIEDNTCYNNGTDNAADHGIYFADGYGHLVRRNHCYDNAGGGLKLNDLDGGESLGGHIVEGNYFHGGRAGIWPTTNNSTFRNNLLYDNWEVGFYVINPITSGYVYNNTIVNHGFGGIGFWGGGITATGLVFKNNLVVQNNAVVGDRKCVTIESGNATVQAAAHTWDYNIYFSDGVATNHVVWSATGGDLTLAAWSALTGTPDTHSQNADPLFVTEFTNLHIGAGSPCIGAGDPALSMEIDKDSVPRGATPVDIGCYEYA